MLDISSAFDTLDQQILLSRLHLIGVRALILSWFTSYLSDRSNNVNIYNYLSSPSPMKYGVPKGSVLGPSLFFIYLYLLPSIIGIINIQISITIYMQMTYNYICFFQLIHQQGPVALEYVWDWPETIPTRIIQRQSLFIGIIGLLWDFVYIF